MACIIGENRPLQQLSADFDIDPVCHSPRGACRLGRRTARGPGVFGIPGAALGYCQALFRYQGDAEAHSRFVHNELSRIHAPWAKSHEIYWGHRRAEPKELYLSNAMNPLVDNGRVPIVITGLDPARDEDEIRELLNLQAPVRRQETVLVRLVISSLDSIGPMSRIVAELVDRVATEKTPPAFWPLLQGDVGDDVWKALAHAIGDAWLYMNVAVNPWTPLSKETKITSQVTVAQVPVGLACGITADGTVQIEPGQLAGFDEGARYNMEEYLTQVSLTVDVPPTIILLGPTKPTWTDEQNALRVAQTLPHLRRALEGLWNKVAPAVRDSVWALPA